MTFNFEDMQKATFWKALAPELHVCDVNYLKQQGAFDVNDDLTKTLVHLLKSEGYFEMAPPQWELPISKLADLVIQINEIGLPTPFSFIYDEFWCLFYRLNRALTAVLGEDFKRLPDFWTWLVDPKKSESGWKPHRDKDYKTLFEDRSPKSLTVWIPLTDSTTLNGCMYIVPADRDPTYGTQEDNQLKFTLADIRALPAKAGSIFCWTQAVYHWGSHTCNRTQAPRISVAFEFQSNNVPAYNNPLMNSNEFPTFSFRMKLVAKQILQYQHMYPLSEEIKEIALQILKMSD